MSVTTSVQAATVFWRIIQTTLGEQEMSRRVPFRIDATSAFIAVETKRKGYRFEKDGLEITIKRVDPWAIIAGLPPLYYFKGDLRYEADGANMTGRILMRTVPKYFIVSWVGAVLLAFLATLIWAMVLAGQVMISPSNSVGDELTTAGFLTGAILGLALFGTLIIALIRAVSQRQKQKLIMFCKGARFEGQ